MCVEMEKAGGECTIFFPYASGGKGYMCTCVGTLDARQQCATYCSNYGQMEAGTTDLFLLRI